MGLFDFFFPKYCVNCRKIGSYICSNCFSYISFDDGGLCLVCDRPSVEGMTHPKCRGRYVIDGAFSSLVYKGATKKLIYTFKYKPFVTDLQKTIGELFYEGIIQKELFHKAFSNSTVLVPIPLHNSKFMARGYNQSGILAKDLGERLKAPVLDVLIRTRSTKSQYGLSRKERKENIDGAFALISTSSIVKSTTVFLVDDILTTGSTLLEAARVLKKHGAKYVWGITLARD